MEYFKIRNTDLKKKRSEEEVKKSLEEFAAKEHPDFIIIEWIWDEERHEGIIQMQSK